MVKTIKTLNLTNRLNKVFILPNNLGFYYIGLWATSFLLSVGYSSNLLLLMAIIELTLFFWWMVTAHADTKQLLVKKIIFQECFAEQKAPLFIYWNDDVISKNINKVTFITEDGITYNTFNELNSYQFVCGKRGLLKIKKICLELQTGFWLFKTWKYLPFSIDIVIYPTPIAPAQNILQNIEKKSQASTFKSTSVFSEELDLQKDVNQTTKPNRINWKRYASHGKLIERYGEVGYEKEESFDLDSVSTEIELSNLTYSLLQSFNLKMPWTIKYKNEILGPFNTSGNNKEELNQCLKLLALHPL